VAPTCSARRARELLVEVLEAAVEVRAEHLVHVHEQAEQLAHEAVVAVHGPRDARALTLGRERDRERQHTEDAEGDLLRVHGADATQNARPISELGATMRRMTSLSFSSSRRRLVGLGVGAALGASVSITAPLLGACSCDPSPPRTEGCDTPLTDFSGIDTVEIIYAGAVNGVQGGSHFQYQIRATGTGLGTCIAQSGTLTNSSGTLASSSTAVRADVDGTEVLSRPVFVFPSRLGGDGHLRVETLGRVVEADVSLDGFRGSPDAYETPDAPFVELDAPTSEDAPIAEDAPVAEDAPIAEDAP
jgi:hypothetical protein